VRRSAFAAVACACLSLVGPDVPAAGSAPVAQGTLQAAFTPWDDVEDIVSVAIDAAGAQILVQAYLLTSRRIAASLIEARKRGVDVRVLVDAVQLGKSSSLVPELVAAGIPVWMETKYQNAHNKIIVIDPATPGATVITGSYNFTWAAQHKNAENILVARRNPTIAGQFAMNWERHRKDALPYRD
jgi:phosphatidylserine/phosphatidylglycerophosphate/cardiolipin synthase-like enzyme